MARALLIAILSFLQLPQAIAGSVAVCFCAGEVVGAAETANGGHCDGSCHSSHAAERGPKSEESESPVGCLPAHEEPCSACLHVSLFAGDTLRAADASVMHVDLVAEFDAPPIPAGVFTTQPPPMENRVDFFVLLSGKALALRC